MGSHRGAEPHGDASPDSQCVRRLSRSSPDAATVFVRGGLLRRRGSLMKIRRLGKLDPQHRVCSRGLAVRARPRIASIHLPGSDHGVELQFSSVGSRADSRCRYPAFEAKATLGRRCSLHVAIACMRTHLLATACAFAISQVAAIFVGRPSPLRRHRVHHAAALDQGP